MGRGIGEMPLMGVWGCGVPMGVLMGVPVGVTMGVPSGVDMLEGTVAGEEPAAAFFFWPDENKKNEF